MIFHARNVWQDFGQQLETPIVHSARFVCTKTTRVKQVANCVGKVCTTMKLNRRQSMPAKNAHAVRTRRLRVLPTWKTATNVLLERKTTTPVLGAVMIARSVLLIQRLPWLDHLNAQHVVQVEHRSKAVSPVRPARLDNLSINLMRASNVLLGTFLTIQTVQYAHNAVLVQKANTVQMDPACVFIAMLVNFNPKAVLLAPAKNVRRANTKRPKVQKNVHHAHPILL